MKRRTLIAAAGAGIAAGGAGVVLGTDIGSSEDPSGPAYRRHSSVAYEHDSLELRPGRETVELGETVAFEVTNTSDSSVSLACDNPWALQLETDDGWGHVAWTGGRYANLCALSLPSGDSHVERLTLSTSWLEEHVSADAARLRPGTYRFVLLGPSPFLATEFTVRDSSS